MGSSFVDVPGLPHSSCLILENLEGLHGKDGPDGTIFRPCQMCNSATDLYLSKTRTKQTKKGHVQEMSDMKHVLSPNKVFQRHPACSVTRCYQNCWPLLAQMSGTPSKSEPRQISKMPS